jgi:ketosteroid isomerase-like protein
MSQENVEVRNEAVRRFLAAFENDSDAFRATLHPEIEWYPIEENRTPTKGVEAAMWNRNAWLDTWVEYHQDVEEVIEDGDDVVLLVHITARAAAERRSRPAGVARRGARRRNSPAEIPAPRLPPGRRLSDARRGCTLRTLRWGRWMASRIG